MVEGKKQMNIKHNNLGQRIYVLNDGTELNIGKVRRKKGDKYDKRNQTSTIFQSNKRW